MEYYIKAIRSATIGCKPQQLKPMLDSLVGQAQEDYKAGELGVAEYGDIVNEYTDTLMATNAVNYM